MKLWCFINFYTNLLNVVFLTGQDILEKLLSITANIVRSVTSHITYCMFLHLHQNDHHSLHHHHIAMVTVYILHYDIRTRFYHTVR